MVVARVHRCRALARALVVLVGVSLVPWGGSLPARADQELAGTPAVAEACGPASLVSDFAARDALPQSDTEPGTWYARNWNGGWGPRASTYPRVEAPLGCDAVEWKRARVLAVARHYLGLPYRHHHIPGWDPSAALTGAAGAGPGLDCSNFTAWVYNYGLGVRFTSDVHKQAEGSEAPGRVLGPEEPLAPGDLLFILRGDRSTVSHVAVYAGDGIVVDSHAGSIAERPLAGWYVSHLSHARRLLE